MKERLANKSTSQVIDKHMHNTTETFQGIFKMFVDEFMIKELLAEGGYVYDAINEDNKVELYFPPVDKEEQRAKENHYVEQYHGHAISEDEMRQELSRDIISDDMRDSMYFERVAAPLAIISAVDEAYGESQVTKTTTATSGNNTTKTVVKEPPKKTPAEGTLSQKNRPVNQSGKLATKPTITKRDALEQKIFNIYDSTREDVIAAYSDYREGDSFAGLSISKLDKTVFKLSKDTIRENVECSEIEDKEFFINRMQDLFDSILNRVEGVFDVQSSYEAVSKINSIFESAKFRLGSYYNTVTTKENTEGTDDGSVRSDS